MVAAGKAAGVAHASWQDLPLPVRAAVERNIGAKVVRSLRQTPEFDGGLAARLVLEGGNRVFVKALPADNPRVGGYRAEADVMSFLPENAPVPRLMSTVDGEWLALVFSDIEGTSPRLRPGSPELSGVLTALGALSRTLTPCPVPGAPDALEDLGPLLRGWSELSADLPDDLGDWAVRNLESLLALESSWHPWAAGDTLLHNDLRPGNLVVGGPGRVQVVNWRYPARGAAWLDLVSLVPYMLAAGHEPAGVDRLLKRRPVLAGVPAWAVTAYGVALAGHYERVSRLPEPPATSGVRVDQQRLAAVTTAWLKHRTGWR
ncbi:hypothetical protein GCM10009754_86340 [Amycolatopsis minnesotensis]|uniref:Aminoglycoside phosphotransferase domain-containing protein n=2 Tax=Amycolatopsis minnesotensis TaxID=337894 RepID=A0ABP5EDN4_9PSEU